MKSLFSLHFGISSFSIVKSLYCHFFLQNLYGRYTENG
jgi:hypothetical protein